VRSAAGHDQVFHISGANGDVTGIGAHNQAAVEV
jgi:hypothetical protein